jgi:hypothetical protein
VAGNSRYALEYGSILLAAVGSSDALKIKKGSKPEGFLGLLVPKPDQPPHFVVGWNEQIEYMIGR